MQYAPAPDPQSDKDLAVFEFLQSSKQLNPEVDTNNSQYVSMADAAQMQPKYPNLSTFVNAKR
jgi:hypothetical protein